MQKEMSFTVFVIYCLIIMNSEWFVPPPEGDGEVKRKNKNQNLNSKQLLTRIPSLLAQIKAESKLRKVENKLGN